MRNPIRRQLPWMKDLRAGDVLWNARCTDVRVVRQVSRFSNDDLRCVTLVIRRCSWTTRCYTVLNYTDLIYRGFHPAPLRAKFVRLVDHHIEKNIRNAAECQTLTCCDVAGVP
mgnify:CR=1 FL=1